MAKEIYLIGVGPEGRESLVGRTLDLIRGCHLIVGGRRVVTQFEDLGIPTYAMSSNLRQLADVIDGAAAAVAEGRDVQEAFARRPSGGPEEALADDEGDLEEDEGSAEGDGEERGPRRRGRRRPSPRSRGRGGRGGGGGGSAGSDDRRAAEGREGEPGTAPDSGPEDDGPGDVPETSILDADDPTVAFSVEVQGGGMAEAEEEEEDAAGGVAVDFAPGEAALPEAPAAEAETPGVEAPGAEAPREHRLPADSAATARIAVLASGDPNLYGLSKFLLERFKREEVTIIPHVSAMQLAFAAIKEPLNDAAITTASGRNVDRLLRVVRQNAKVGIFTDKRRSPRAVARLLSKHGIEARCYVCQDLGSARERIIMGSLEEIGKKNFSPLSVMILFKAVDEAPAAAVPPQGGREGYGRESAGRESQGREAQGREPQRPDQGRRSAPGLKEIPPPGRVPKYELVTGLGIPDEMLAARPEKMMRAEMRVIVLSKLGLTKTSRMWDVGASSGALAVEAARVAHDGEVFAIERDFAQIRNIYENIKEFGLANVTVIEGDIEALAAGLPEPDRIFVGGCGGRMSAVLDACLRRLKPQGTLVINATTLDSLTEVQQVLKAQRLRHDLVIVNLSKTVERGGLEYFEGFNPAYLITTRKD
jgi:precorrin-6B C5,15-methyltransferase / cobalt-precorrin-6B C5,C15-methyltransferase